MLNCSSDSILGEISIDASNENYLAKKAIQVASKRFKNHPIQSMDVRFKTFNGINAIFEVLDISVIHYESYCEIY